jgi:hypothetical protein
MSDETHTWIVEYEHDVSREGQFAPSSIRDALEKDGFKVVSVRQNHIVSASDLRDVHRQMHSLMVAAKQAKAKGTLRSHISAVTDATAVTARQLALTTLGLPLPDDYDPDWYEKLP